MITQSRRGHLLVEIGQGDVCVDFGADQKDKVAYMAMRELSEAAPVPEAQEFNGEVYANALDYPLIISFSNLAAIDAVAAVLQRCREALLALEGE